MTLAVRVVCYGLSNGFRTPLAQSAQDTLPLPAPTQLIGLLGAAAGISRAMMPELYSKFSVGVIGVHKTTYQDLTKIVKYGAKGKIKQPTALLMRENLYDSEFTIWYLPKSNITASSVMEFFQNPKYALSLGRDDELIRIDQVEIVEVNETEEAVIHDTVVPFSLDPQCETIVESSDFMIPLVPIELPRSFDVSSRLIRSPRDFREYTFIEGYKIRTTRKGALDDNGKQFFPL
ncbi:MAG: CRISPR-associated protein Cas5 [Thermoplasmatales archaeon]